MRVIFFLLGIIAVWVARRIRRATLGAEPLYTTDAVAMKTTDAWARKR